MGITMDDGRILGLSLAVSTIGLVLLYIVSTLQGPVSVTSIAPEDIGSRVYVKGKISGFNTSPDGHVFFTLKEGGGDIKVVLFKGVARDVSCVEEGRIIALRGRVDEFYDELEVIPAKARDIEC